MYVALNRNVILVKEFGVLICWDDGMCVIITLMICWVIVQTVCNDLEKQGNFLGEYKLL